jgi:methyltransferase
VVSAANLALVATVAAGRLLELSVARRNTRSLLAAGGVEHGRAHYTFMVALHAALLAGCVVEPWVAARPFAPIRFAAGAVAVGAAAALRWWTIATLAGRWTTRVVVLPGRPLVTGGPFRFLRHPNYLAVAVEVAALPLAVGAWITALAGTLLNGILLVAVRIPCEEAALGLGVSPR